VLIQGIVTKFLSYFCDLYFIFNEFPKMEMHKYKLEKAVGLFYTGPGRTPYSVVQHDCCEGEEKEEGLTGTVVTAVSTRRAALGCRGRWVAPGA
jgi:hypothetical protein